MIHLLKLQMLILQVSEQFWNRLSTCDSHFKEAQKAEVGCSRICLLSRKMNEQVFLLDEIYHCH